MTHHGSAASNQVKALDTEFIDGFALVGAPTRCSERILELVELGLDRLHLWTASADTEAGRESYSMAVDKVLAKVR